MRQLKRLWAILFLVSAIGCSTTPPGPLPTTGPLSAPAPTRIRIPAGETLRLPVEPQAGPTEENPTLTFQIVTIDKLRQTSVQVQFVKLGGREIAREVSEFAVKLPGNTVDTPLLLEIIADWYETWSVVLRQRVVHSRTVYFEVELSPKSPRAKNGFCASFNYRENKKATLPEVAGRGLNHWVSLRKRASTWFDSREGIKTFGELYAVCNRGQTNARMGFSSTGHSFLKRDFRITLSA